MFYFNLFFGFLFTLTAGALQLSDLDLFSPVATLDGVSVSYSGVSNDEMSESGKSVAYAVYREDRAQIIYDLDLFERIDDYSKFLILEHERAHHYLGHSLASKTYEELNQPLENMSLLYRKEKDADCAAGFKSKELYPTKNRADVLESFKRIYKALVQNNQVETYPSWVYNRADKTATCLEGVLLPYPETIEL